MTKVAPSILSADFARLGDEVSRLDSSGADWVHVDVMDGMFVPNITIGPSVIKAIRPYSTLPFDVHLMIAKPRRYLKAFADAGADSLTIHVEAEDDVLGALRDIKDMGMKAGLSLNPDTPFSAVEDHIGEIDLLLVMTVPPGFGGQPFREDCLPKIGRAREIIDSLCLKVDIEVDGGINETTALKAVGAGASVLAAGSALFKAKDMPSTIRRWQALPMGKFH